MSRGKYIPIGNVHVIPFSHLGGGKLSSAGCSMVLLSTRMALCGVLPNTSDNTPSANVNTHKLSELDISANVSSSHPYQLIHFQVF